MNIQLPLPVIGNLISLPDPRDQLAAIDRDITMATAEIRAVLERIGRCHDVSPDDIDAAIEGYAGDMLGDLFHEARRELEREIESPQIYSRRRSRARP